MEVNARGRKPAAERGGRSWGAVWASTDKEVWSCWVCLLLHLQCSGCLLCAVCSSCAAQEDGFLPWGPVAGLGLSSCAGMARCHLGHGEVLHADMVKDMARCSSGHSEVPLGNMAVRALSWGRGFPSSQALPPCCYWSRVSLCRVPACLSILGSTAPNPAESEGKSQESGDCSWLCCSLMAV